MDLREYPLELIEMILGMCDANDLLRCQCVSSISCLLPNVYLLK
jgi:hypothetical protein